MSEMVEVQFVPDEKRVWVRPGATLVEAGAAAGVEIITGCTQGMCGTDPVFVASGAECLEVAGADERATLDRMGIEPEFRLACSARVARPGVVVIELGRF